MNTYALRSLHGTQMPGKERRLDRKGRVELCQARGLTQMMARGVRERANQANRGGQLPRVYPGRPRGYA